VFDKISAWQIVLPDGSHVIVEGMYRLDDPFVILHRVRAIPDPRHRMPYTIIGSNSEECADLAEVVELIVSLGVPRAVAEEHAPSLWEEMVALPG
jgi:hypothetical protein